MLPYSRTCEVPWRRKLGAWLILYYSLSRSSCAHILRSHSLGRFFCLVGLIDGTLDGQNGPDRALISLTFFPTFTQSLFYIFYRRKELFVLLGRWWDKIELEELSIIMVFFFGFLFAILLVLFFFFGPFPVLSVNC